MVDCDSFLRRIIQSRFFSYQYPSYTMIKLDMPNKASKSKITSQLYTLNKSKNKATYSKCYYPQHLLLEVW